MDRALALEFVCYVGAGLGVLAYVLSYLRGRFFTRLFNTAGLVLTAVALVVLPTAIRISDPEANVTAGWITALALLAALWTQGWAALKRRKPREGLQERAGDRPTEPA